ncbi:hypothetical protein [Secundilactobacillus similis]|uniref:Major facilitator superfamily (MFS) profile domain-containing protein n=1 Tax=Secundilactobacillus similis DSM 23365 = JCM 2765 TaxID=1423804 RepID=A0A0R2F9N8_9LACO|nr:hypothetical protein [Secundilactobacillus similis]KRN21581.1 hypothetical protein FD14_GL001023 [Secundilactobacillus similis DSM 23365 = JCM 2765]
MASSLNISAFNVGVMLGSFTGGQIVSQFGLAMTPVGGLVLSLLALGLIGVAVRMAKTTA